MSKTAAKFGDRNLLGSLLAFGVPVAVALNVGELLENRETVGVVRVPVAVAVAARARSVASVSGHACRGCFDLGFLGGAVEMFRCDRFSGIMGFARLCAWPL